jgi:hypothetical protein
MEVAAHHDDHQLSAIVEVVDNGMLAGVFGAGVLIAEAVG